MLINAFRVKIITILTVTLKLIKLIYIGSKNCCISTSRKAKKRSGRSTQAVRAVSLIQCHGKVITHQVKNINTFTLTNEIIAYVKQTAEIYIGE